MNKEQEIYSNMKKKGRIYKKKNGKFGINYASLFTSIRESGYNNEQAEKIINGMVTNGYLYKNNDLYNKGLRYTILKWAN